MVVSVLSANRDFTFLRYPTAILLVLAQVITLSVRVLTHCLSKRNYSCHRPGRPAVRPGEVDCQVGSRVAVTWTPICTPPSRMQVYSSHTLAHNVERIVGFVGTVGLSFATGF